MILFYLRHGDPIYNPNTLTPLGELQARALTKRLALYGIDEVYSSPSNRAVLTAKPTAELVKKEINLVDFADEAHVWKSLTCERDGGGVTWIFQHPEKRKIMSGGKMRSLGDRWYDYPGFEKYETGITKVYDDTDSFLKSLGYEHERYTGTYNAINPSDKRIALFAHEGFGLAFLSCVLDIPYPVFSTHFLLSHSNMTVIEFPDEDGISIPRILTHSSDSHLYKEGLPTKYNNTLYF